MRKNSEGKATDEAAAGNIEAGAMSMPAILWRAGVLLALVAVAVIVALANPASTRSGNEAGVVMNLPYQAGQYWGYDQEISKAERVILPEDTEFARKMYDTMEGDQVFASIVLAGAQRQSIHRPEVCLPAQGWSIANRETRTIALANGQELEVALLHLVRPVQFANGETREVRSLYAYWFVGRDRTTPSHFSREIESMFDRVFKGINHRWAYVTISAMVTEGLKPSGRNAEQTYAVIEDFIANTADQFMKPEAFGLAAR